MLGGGTPNVAVGCNQPLVGAPMANSLSHCSLHAVEAEFVTGNGLEAGSGNSRRRPRVCPDFRPQPGTAKSKPFID